MMSVPPFPSQDLAKLVLGYLAEEQLMTAYDEFLQASPYLDAFQNEFDRIFMTSLRNILAEYRAVKIYVETCKPYALRRRLFGCTNLLEVVKFLIENVDVNKIHQPDTSRRSLDPRNVTEKSSLVCSMCHTSQLDSCVCKSRQSLQPRTTKTSLNLEENNLESSVETTSLKDLPGNHVNTKKKQVKVLNKDSTVSELTSCDLVDSNSENSAISINPVPNTIPPQNESHSIIPIESKSVPSIQRTDEDILKQNVPTNRVSIAGTFQDFSKGVRGSENIHSNVPDSSTSENISMQPTTTKKLVTSGTVNSTGFVSSKTVSKAHIFLTVGTVKNNRSQPVPVVEGNPVDVETFAGNLRPKGNEQKVTILSDIKVDNTLASENPNIPPVLKNATSTPLMQMQTILINGTPVYKQQPNRNFTKDEIMAMPTIIVVPKTVASQMPAPPTLQSIKVSTQYLHTSSSTISSTAQSLEPLIIDVSDSPVKKDCNINTENITATNQTVDSGTGMLVKTVEGKNVSVPKDHTDLSNKSTPHALPPTRKSSSTPRRSSHVRVLDFTTPRRILAEPIAETDAENLNTAVEVIVSRSPNFHTFVNAVSTDDENVTASEDNEAIHTEQNSSGSLKDTDDVGKKVLTTKKEKNWDADLRALAIANKKEDMENIVSCIKSRCRPLKPKNDKKNKNEKDNKKSLAVKKTESKPQNKSKKSKKKFIEVTEEPAVVEESTNVPVKPTINIITGPDWNSQEPEKVHNKTNNEELVDTPEMDRISLQNVIGAKLNISDLLETPYKQALYDIQMETPRFLGPDLPDAPMSDIKIMNIPTPRFLNTAKPVQATPSSYSSRPTDYSSGGSYYKPDDQDYLPVDDLGYPTLVSEEKNIGETMKIEATEVKERDVNQKAEAKSGRPVRKCTKNVSYRSASNKTKDTSDKFESASSCSESMSVNCSIENKKEPKTVKDTKSRKNKSEIKKKSIAKKYKTPVKTPKSFLKIKPRRVTPTKESVGGKSRTPKTTEGPGRKRTTSKTKNVDSTPVVICAPTKSRRKSSTPRKLHCTKPFNSESSGHESPEITSNSKQVMAEDSCAQDSDTDQIPLRWSDDGSQDDKSKETQDNESEDISKIKEYITSELNNAARSASNKEPGSPLHVNLVKRGFDLETAKIIERDLLDIPPIPDEIPSTEVKVDATKPKTNEVILEKTIESDTSCNLKTVQEEEDSDEEIELSVVECNEGSKNYIECYNDDTKNLTTAEVTKLKDKFCMEVCLDEDLTIRLRPTPLTTSFEIDLTDLDKSQNRQEVEDLTEYNYKETEMAVNSISNFERLYTPIKDSIRAQVFDIFDSTLTSLDTPLKANSPKSKECDTTVTEIVLEVEKLEEKEKPEGKKRKRLNSGDSEDSSNGTKRAKPETQYLLNSASIQNIDIETVLSKLHGP